MSVDKHFLTKYKLYRELLNAASCRNTRGKNNEIPFTGLDPTFCEMVIKKSQIVKWPAPEAHSISLEQLCGMIPDEQETNRYYYMAAAEAHDFRNIVVYELWQHHNSDFPVHFTLEIDIDQFNKYLNYIFSYCDQECMDAYIYDKFKGGQDE